MLPDAVARNIGLCIALHDLLQRLVVVDIELIVIEAIGPFLDQGFVVYDFLQIQIVLIVIRIDRYELTSHR